MAKLQNPTGPRPQSPPKPGPQSPSQPRPHTPTPERGGGGEQKGVPRPPKR